MKIRLPVSAVLILFFQLPGVCLAQQTVTSAMLSGRIEDATGAAVSGASVTAINLDTSQRLTSSTDHEGRYRFPDMRVGAHDITNNAQGVAGLTKQLKLSLGQS